MHVKYASSHEGLAAVDLQRVSFSYAGDRVLDDITLKIEDKDYVGLIGPNGGGKTTLIKIILGLIRPSSGSVRVYGQPPEGARIRPGIGYVPQRVVQPDFRFPGSVEELVMSGRTARIGIGRWPGAADRDAVTKAMNIADVLPLQKRLVDTLSGGERQKVFIARALAAEPRMLILDEPVTAVDVKAREHFYEFLRSLNKDLGLTIIFVSHDIDVITREAESILCLNQKLLCHCPTCSLDQKDAINMLYGSDAAPVHHHH